LVRPRARRSAELGNQRDLAVGSHVDPGAEVGDAVAVDIESDQAVEAFARLWVDDALGESIGETLGRPDDVAGGADEGLRPGRLVALAGVRALVGQCR